MKYIYQSIFYFAAFILLACNGRAQKKLAIIGSSTSACFNVVSIDSCYVTRLQKYYNDIGSPIVLDNKAKAGDDCYKGMPSSYTPPLGRPGPEQDRNINAVLAGNPDVVLINYPSNEYNVYSIAEVMFCLRTMKKAANDAGKPCYITTTQPRTSYGSPTRYPSFDTPQVKLKMITLKDSILHAFGSFAINFWDGIVNPADTALLPQYNYGDSTHLTSAGHKILSDKVIATNIFTGSALPVTFTGFSAYISNKQTYIQWTTAIEQDISSYNIEKSDDGASFHVVQQVPARHASQMNNYSVADQSPSAARSYYRVVAISTSGQPSYTKVIQVVSNGLSYQLQKIVVSGPSVRAELHAAEKQVITLQLVNNTGQLLSKLTATINAGFNTILMPASLPGNGIYFLRITNSSLESQVKSFVKE